MNCALLKSVQAAEHPTGFEQHRFRAAASLAAIERDARPYVAEPGATVIATGADVTDDPAPYLAHGVQYTLVGEGDHTLLELIAALEAGAARAELDLTRLVRRPAAPRST